MRVAIDTNRLTDLFRGDTELAAQLAVCDEVWLPLTVVGEIKAGFYGGANGRRNELLLHLLLSKPTVHVLLPDMATAHHYARVFVQLKEAGTPIPDNDLWIAAMALQNELTLITRDQHFKRIPQLPLG